LVVPINLKAEALRFNRSSITSKSIKGKKLAVCDSNCGTLITDASLSTIKPLSLMDFNADVLALL